MKPHFLFPASPLNQGVIDEDFQDQAAALKNAGFETSVLTDDMKIVGPLSDIDGDPDVRVVYRGWMMDAEGYRNYLDKLAARPVRPLTDYDEYLAAHWIPNWYPLLEGKTPETVTFPNAVDMPERLVSFCRQQGEKLPKLLIKDYVKSLKTAGGSVVSSADEIEGVLKNMEKYRGGIEGGICLRRWEDFIPGSETRYFVIGGRFYGQEPLFDMRAMEILVRVARDVPSPFFSVDIAERTDGRFRVVEIGDGQVSGLVGWTPERFAEVWKDAAK